jgi:hypothetical protein
MTTLTIVSYAWLAVTKQAREVLKRARLNACQEKHQQTTGRRAKFVVLVATL